MDVLTEFEDTILKVTINRPDKRNAISDGVVDGLLGAFDDAERNRKTKAIVLTGAGDRTFCAGGDLSSFASSDELYTAHQARGKFGALLRRFRDSKIPIVGRVNGHAMGGGFGLAMACDVVVASTAAKFGLAEVKVGVFPMMIMPVIIRNIGRKRALELMLTGAPVGATTLEDWGAVNYAVSPDELDDKVAEVAGAIASYSSATLALGRAAFYRVEDMTFDQAVSSLQNDLTITTLTEDAKEGVTAFMEKREPNWKGR